MIPVILDTDIGTDIDDTWALAMLLNSPELQLEAVVTSHGDTRYRALLVAKMLAVAGREDVPVGEGTGDGKLAPDRRGQETWLDGYEPDAYGGVYRNRRCPAHGGHRHVVTRDGHRVVHRPGEHNGASLGDGARDGDKGPLRRHATVPSDRAIAEARHRCPNTTSFIDVAAFSHRARGAVADHADAPSIHAASSHWRRTNTPWYATLRHH